ncbi:MAG: HI1506-related protein [Gluconacetobacter sp.]
MNEDQNAAVLPDGKKGAAKVAARLLSTNSREDVEGGKLIIVCRKPGLRRAGVVHPGVHVHAIRKFSASQMDELKAEPLLEVIEIV